LHRLIVVRRDTRAAIQPSAQRGRTSRAIASQIAIAAKARRLDSIASGID
jgi:hypothetical protein